MRRRGSGRMLVWEGVGTLIDRTRTHRANNLCGNRQEMSEALLCALPLPSAIFPVYQVSTCRISQVTDAPRSILNATTSLLLHLLAKSRNGIWFFGDYMKSRLIVLLPGTSCSRPPSLSKVARTLLLRWSIVYIIVAVKHSNTWHVCDL